jgi:hypothetical protein
MLRPFVRDPQVLIRRIIYDNSAPLNNTRLSGAGTTRESVSPISTLLIFNIDLKQSDSEYYCVTKRGIITDFHDSESDDSDVAMLPVLRQNQLQIYDAI